MLESRRLCCGKQHIPMELSNRIHQMILEFYFLNDKQLFVLFVCKEQSRSKLFATYFEQKTKARHIQQYHQPWQEEVIE
jgi:hypothetical protein